MGRRTFSKEYKLQIIKQVIEEGKRITEVSRSLGVTEQTVYRWLREYDKYGEKVVKALETICCDRGAPERIRVDMVWSLYQKYGTHGHILLTLSWISLDPVNPLPMLI